MEDNATAAAPPLRGLGQVSLFVQDIDRAVEFYRETLGLTYLFTAGELAFLDVGGVRLYLHACGSDDWRPSSILYFTVDDIDSMWSHLQARRVKTNDAPHAIYTDEAAGVQEWMAFFEDTEGNTLALLSRVPVASTEA